MKDTSATAGKFDADILTPCKQVRAAAERDFLLYSDRKSANILKLLSKKEVEYSATDKSIKTDKAFFTAMASESGVKRMQDI